MKLIHPTLGLCAQEVVGASANVVKNKWKHRYGKKFNECSILIESDEPVKKPCEIKRNVIVNVITGDEYQDTEEASKETGLSKETIRKHLARKLAKQNSHKYIVKWA
jgi:hypothetical protein